GGPRRIMDRCKVGQVRVLASTAPGPAQADIAGDRREPMRVSLRIVQTLPMPPGLDQRLLSQIFGGVRVAREARAQPHQPGALGRQRGLDLERLYTLLYHKGYSLS